MDKLTTQVMGRDGIKARKDEMKLAHLYCGERALSDIFKRELPPVVIGTIPSGPASIMSKAPPHAFWDSHSHTALTGSTTGRHRPQHHLSLPQWREPLVGATESWGNSGCWKGMW